MLNCVVFHSFLTRSCGSVQFILRLTLFRAHFFLFLLVRLLSQRALVLLALALVCVCLVRLVALETVCAIAGIEQWFEMFKPHVNSTSLLLFYA